MRRGLLQRAFLLLGVTVFFGGLAYLGWHTSVGHNGARTVGSAALIGVGFAIVFSLVDLSGVIWKKWRKPG